VYICLSVELSISNIDIPEPHNAGTFLIDGIFLRVNKVKYDFVRVNKDSF